MKVLAPSIGAVHALMKIRIVTMSEIPKNGLNEPFLRICAAYTAEINHKAVIQKNLIRLRCIVAET